MTQQTINIGAAPDDGTGDPLRTAFDKVNDNDGELYQEKLGLAAWSDIASAATTAIGGVASSAVNVTGTTTITSFGTIAAGVTRLVKFAGVLTLTHNGTSLILPGSANISTAAGDALLAVSEGSGNWRVTGYWRASGRSVMSGEPLPSGRWLIPEGPQTLGTGAALGADSMRGFRGYIRRAVTITGLGLRVTTAAASGNARIHVYASNATSLAPTGAPVHSTANLSTASTGIVTETSISVALSEGWYWFLTLCDTNAATAVFQALGSTSLSQSQSYGSATAATTLGAGAAITSIARSTTFGSPPTLTGNFTTDSIAESNGGASPLAIFLTA